MQCRCNVENRIWGAVSFQTKTIIDPKGTIEGIKQTVNDVKETIKTDIEFIKHPIEGTNAVIAAVKEDPKKAAEVVGETNGQVAAAIVVGKGVKSVGGGAVEGAAAKLGQRGGVGVGSTKVVRVVAKSNPSETSVNVIAGGKRVLDVGKAQIRLGRPKQFHIRVKDGPHRSISGKNLDETK